ncbi:L-type lectin-domain containing receptor kinase S.6 [Argentina anserina]|uniref:L-type lectin-domain containing receptor kinase S.6 n=1 Tax=Argentina anserina TaxID=57926 RepID=UPI0021765491|nr:L-type lectin-domain containing receptor kinase S.6 [Potentilla anserina]
MTIPSYPFALFTLLFVFFNLSLSHPLHLPPPSTNITLSGDASITHNAISLTQPLSTCPSTNASEFSVGRAFYSHPVRFLDPETKDFASFLTRFTFSMTQLCSSGDGMAFVITSHVEEGLSYSKGFMGLPQDSFFAVEFDTSFDPVIDDINGSHVGIDLNTVESVASVNAGIDLVGGKEVTAWVEYRNDLKLVRVWVGYSSENKPPGPVIVAQIDLSKQFKELVYVGFCASNGKGSSAYIVESWRFKTFNGSLPSVIPMDFWEEQDCFMCGESSSDISYVGVKKTKMEMEIVFGLVGLAALVLSLVAVYVICCVCGKKRKGRARRSIRGCRVETSRVPTSLSLEEITSATMGFDRSRIVGEGATAKVYKGCLLSGGEVAVKRFEKANGLDRLRGPFTNEFATMAGCLRHKNLVQLHGWCCEGNELVLVYEFMPNGSLNKILHRSFNAAVVLSWRQRLNIVLGVASALAYLHEECERQIIHRDVKTCNIMLDAEFNAKLGDFGLAEVYDHSSITREATIPAGTMGYLAPEYVYSGVPTVKTDVYSFGVVMLEVATGRKPVEDDGTVIVDWVWGLWEVGKLIEGADSRLAGKFDKVEMERMLMTGLACVHPNHAKRPTVKEAARILQGEAPLPVLPARKPRVSLRPIFHDDTEEFRNLCAGRFSLELDDVPYMTPKSHFGNDQ